MRPGPRARGSGRLRCGPQRGDRTGARAVVVHRHSGQSRQGRGGCRYGRGVQPSGPSGHRVDGERVDNRESVVARGAAAGDRVVIDDQIEICHGTPFDEDVYVFDEMDALQSVDAATRPVCLFGHTHVPAMFRLGPSGAGSDALWPDRSGTGHDGAHQRVSVPSRDRGAIQVSSQLRSGGPAPRPGRTGRIRHVRQRVAEPDLPQDLVRHHDRAGKNRARRAFRKFSPSGSPSVAEWRFTAHAAAEAQGTERHNPDFVCL